MYKNYPFSSFLYYDLEQEVRRKDQLELWFARTPAEIEEEKKLIQELALMQQRRRERMVHAQTCYKFMKIMQEKIDARVKAGGDLLLGLANNNSCTANANLDNDAYDDNQHNSSSDLLNSIQGTFNNSNKNRAHQRQRTITTKSHKSYSDQNKQFTSPRVTQNNQSSGFTSEGPLLSPNKQTTMTRSSHATTMRNASLNIIRKTDDRTTTSNRKPINRNIWPIFTQYCGDVSKIPMPTVEVVGAYNELRNDICKLADLKSLVEDIDKEIVLAQQRKKL